MIASSVFVLAALTMTGIYVRRSSEQTENDGYHIDFSVLDSNVKEPAQNEPEEIENVDVDIDFTPTLEDDMDYFPMEQVDSGLVEISGLTDTSNGGNESNGSSGNGTGDSTPIDAEQTEAAAEDALDQSLAAELAAELAADQAAMDADAGRVVENVMPSFAAGEALVWPVSGRVLIPYSMDKMVRFATLEQYKYSPALVMSAAEGDTISAAAGGRVTRIFTNEEIGNAVMVDIGNGYVITYGQLKDIAVTEGSYVEKGGIIGYVAKPTIYYSVEGTNAYFALTLNGQPADPLGKLQ